RVSPPRPGPVASAGGPAAAADEGRARFARGILPLLRLVPARIGNGSGMPVALDAVPETLLWNLHHRAAEARRPDTVLPDPRAVELVDTMDFPFAARFGPAAPALAQWQALRAACFDREERRFLRHHPARTLVP